MSDELQNNSELELVDKVAVVAVFLLAGVFFWQFVGAGDEHLRSVDGDEWTVKSDDLDRTPYTVEALDIDPHVIEEVRRPVKVESPVLAKKTVGNIVSNEVIEKIAPLVPAAVVMPMVKPVEVIKEIVEPVVEIATPTIRPVTSDLSKGVLRLSGTGEPRSHLQLMLNGQKTTKIDIDERGEWLYETNLEAGDYSIQVIPPELNEQLSNKSAIANISIPKPELVIKVEEPEVIKEKAVIVAPVVKKIKEQPKLSPKSIPVVRKKVTFNKNLYTVKYGDTLNKLSRRFKVSLSDILRSNNISDKDVIEVGDMLVIPGYFSGKKEPISDVELRKSTYSPEKDEWGF